MSGDRFALGEGFEEIERAINHRDEQLKKQIADEATERFMQYLGYDTERTKRLKRDYQEPHKCHVEKLNLNRGDTK